MHIRTCTPVREKKMSLVLASLKKAEKFADITEIWLDEIYDLDLKKLISAAKKPVLAKGSFALVSSALEAGADFIDIDIEQKNLKKHLTALKKLRRESGARGKIIVSYHNFTSTPDIKELLQKTDSAFKAGADIVKIAITIKDFGDNAVLLELVYHLRAKRKNIICVGMGEKGKLSRIMTPLLGGYLTYVALDKSRKTAPGQLTISEFKKYLADLNL